MAVELAGETGRVVGVDLQPCAPVEGAVLLTGDITESMTQERILAELGGQQLNVIVSDISPDITGKWDMDQSVAMTLVADVFDFALPLLVKGADLRPNFSRASASRNSYLPCGLISQACVDFPPKLPETPRRRFTLSASTTRRGRRQKHRSGSDTKRP